MDDLAAPDDDDGLVIDFLDTEYPVGPNGSITFGRSGDIVIDESPFLHRIVGRFAPREGLWWLQNHGTRTVIELRDDHSSGGGGQQRIPPGHQAPVVSQQFVVTFAAGPTTYELTGRRLGPELAAAFDPDVPLEPPTIDFGVIPLSEEQHLLLLVLSAPRLGGVDELPSNQAIATTLGWPITKFNRKLDAVCAKLARQGVRGLRGEPGTMAADRRRVLVEHAVSSGLVGPDDLGLLRGMNSSTAADTTKLRAASPEPPTTF